MTYGIRIRRPWWPKSRGWIRGNQYKRATTPTGWTYWRDEWPSRETAAKRLAAYRLTGWVGHVFEVDPDGYEWLVVDSDTSLPHPELARLLDETGRRCGRVLRIREGTRSRARQQELWNANPDPRWVAYPGTSNHEDQNGDGYGIAADVGDAVDGENLRPMLERRGLYDWFRRQGAHFPMTHEPWHAELIGVPR